MFSNAMFDDSFEVIENNVHEERNSTTSSTSSTTWDERSEEGIMIKSDYLLKLPSKGLRGRQSLFNWRRRWVTLHNNSLKWYESKDHGGNMKGGLCLGPNETVAASHTSSTEFSIYTSTAEDSLLTIESRFRARSNKERDEWISLLWQVTGYKSLESPPLAHSDENYERQNRLGRGSFGVVYKARDLANSCEVAIKCINCKHMLSRGVPLRVIEREVDNLMNMKHQHIVNLHSHFMEDQVIHLVMEYCEGGDLAGRIQVLGKYPVNDARQVTFELFDALAYCHSKGIVHRDIKPANILLKHVYCNTDIVLIDFGLSKLVSEDACVQTTSMHTPVGTMRYAAPEVFDKAIAGYRDGTSPQKVDIWSAGAVVYTMLEGHTIQIQQPRDSKAATISQKNVDVALSSVVQSSRQFLKAALNCNTLERPVAADLLLHPWINVLGITENQTDEEENQQQKQNLQQKQNFEAGWEGHSIPRTPTMSLRCCNQEEPFCGLSSMYAWPQSPSAVNRTAV